MNTFNKIRQLFCRHKFKSIDTQCHVDGDSTTITETCHKCGKIFSFTVPTKNFGL